MGAEDQGGAVRDLIDLIDEDGPAGAEPLDHEAVVDHLVTDIDGWGEEVQDPLDDFDGAIDSGTKAAGIGEENIHDRQDNGGQGGLPTDG